MEEKNPAQASPPSEPSNQKSQIQLSEFKNSRPLVITIAVILAFTIGGAGGYFLGLAKGSQKESLPQRPQPTTQPQAKQQTPTPAPISSEGDNKSAEYWKKRLLLEKEYGSFRLGAFDTDDLLFDSFIIVPVDNGIPSVAAKSYAVSFAQNAFMKDNLFDVVDQKIYLVNQKNSFIDVYQASFSEKTLATPAFYAVDFIESVSSPDYKVGVPYSIMCEGVKCQIKTAHHQQSGCSMDLDLETKQYSNIKCSRMDGEFNPEPL
jgi:hypothetical protein